MYLIKHDTRAAIFTLNYKTNIDPKNINPYTPMGPNLLGEQLWPVAVEGNKLGLSLIAPEQ